MGTTKDPKLWINTKKLGKKIIPCNDEMLALLACFKKCDFVGTESKCAAEQEQPRQQRFVGFDTVFELPDCAPAFARTGRGPRAVDQQK